VYTHIYLAEANYQLKRYPQARESLLAALEIAASDRLILPFVENSEYILPLLIEMENSAQYVEFIASVRACCALYAKKRQAI